VSRTVRVLVAEDNEDHRYLITRALQSIDGVRVDVATVVDGADALDYLYQRGRYEGCPRPHLMVLDLRMPRVPGHVVLETVKGDPDLRSIPVAVLSSSAQPADVTRCYAAYANTYLLKRPMFGDLREKVRAMGSFWADVALLPEPPA
jgi:CheY-like chemotaxis protein